MVESTLVHDIDDLYREQMEARCKISYLYGNLLLSQGSADGKLASASHDWSLRSIQSIAEDLHDRLPKGHEPVNPYSRHFLTESDDHKAVVSELRGTLRRHSDISTRIEQHGKGVL